MDNNKIQKGFEKALLLEITNLDSLRGDEGSGPGPAIDRPSRRTVDPRDDRKAFDADRTPGQEKTDLSTDGQDIDVTAAQAEVIDALYAHVDNVIEMVESLNNPSDENSLNRFLAKLERPDSIGTGLSDKLDSEILKAVNALDAVKNKLRSVLGREEPISRKQEALRRA